MRLYLDTHYFISVIKKDEKFSCQVMELIHGLGMYNAEITDDTKDDIVSSIVDSKSFKETNKTCSSMQDSGTQPQEEIPALFTVKVDEQYFKAGPDIIVIWPMTTLPPRDSIRIPITIHQVLGIEGLTKNKYYLSVNGNQLTIHSGVNVFLNSIYNVY